MLKVSTLTLATFLEIKDELHQQIAQFVNSESVISKAS